MAMRFPPLAELNTGRWCAVALMLTLTACAGQRERQVAFDGHVFKAKASAVDKAVSRADFTATVSGVSKSLEGAREAGRYEGTKYCIVNYGSSRINWAVGPDTAPAQLRVVDDSLTFAGRCDS